MAGNHHSARSNGVAVPEHLIACSDPIWASVSGVRSLSGRWLVVVRATERIPEFDARRRREAFVVRVLDQQPHPLVS